MINWEKKEWNKNTITDVHGNVFFYRDLYEGNHAQIFSRAKELISKGEIVDNIMEGPQKAQNVQTPYIMANISRLIPEIPAMLVSRSIGQINSSLNTKEEQLAAMNKETAGLIDGPEGDEANNTVYDLQQELIEQIVKNSNLTFEHWTNIVQQQLDGGLVGVPWMDDDGIRIDFKQRDVYFPHDDGKGVDLVYEREFDGDRYLHVYRERVEEGNLLTSNRLYSLPKSGDQLTPVDEMTAKRLLGIELLDRTFEGRSRPFVEYWANEKTFMNPLGRSCLKNQEGKQDEINWTLTRNAITFERNGKPRIAVSKEIFTALQDAALQRYGPGGESRIDHRDLEVVTFDDEGKAMEIIQIDVTKIGDLTWVKDLMKLMLMETSTSEKAVDFYLGEGSKQAAQSGIAKFYDLFVSLTKAEQVQKEYVYFLQNLIENCLWLANQDNPAVLIERPEIHTKAMVPISRQELLEENSKAYTDGIQSLETTIKAIHPHAADDWIQEEIERIKAEDEIDDNPYPDDGGDEGDPVL
ncbi:hypothetical protein MKZ02_20020 [Pseudobacillus sp. FSL P4-0506]|uniref:hypothetical protein n=1 Tax=Pseudobacillus sp. FSL P4-0506 TaxID=2921576 RepID=UPI0030F96E5D